MDAVEIAKSCADRALESASFALEVALRPIDGAVTPATEAHLQKAIDQLRKSGDRGPVLPLLERIATDLHIILDARRCGRPNLYASRLARLRRMLFHDIVSLHPACGTE